MMKSVLYGIIISIHAPREGGDGLSWASREPIAISIHAPREGGDPVISMRICGLLLFQSTPPARGATYVFAPGSPSFYDFNPRPPRGGRLLDFLGTVLDFIISIHAPREGGDLLLCYCNSFDKRFQSTPPARGATWVGLVRIFFVERFQSTPPARGATRTNDHPHNNNRISIHAPREGGDAAGVSP